MIKQDDSSREISPNYVSLKASSLEFLNFQRFLIVGSNEVSTRITSEPTLDANKTEDELSEKNVDPNQTFATIELFR